MEVKLEQDNSDFDGGKLRVGTSVKDGVSVGSTLFDGALDEDGAPVGRNVDDGDADGIGVGQPQQLHGTLLQSTAARKAIGL